MKAPQGEWRKDTGRFANGKVYWLGRVKVGSAWFDGALSRGVTRRYRASLDLPGVKFSEGQELHETEDDAKAMVERAVGVWFGWVGESATDTKAA